MHKRVKRKRRRKYIYIGLALVMILGVFWLFVRGGHRFVRSDNVERVVVNDDGKEVVLRNVSARTVDDVLSVYDGDIGDEDRVFPPRDEDVFADDVINITRKKTLIVKVGDEEQKFETYGEKIGEVLIRQNVEFDENDIFVPVASTVVTKDITTELIRVEFKEEIITKDIPFKKIVKEDDDISFLKKYVDQEGKKGEKKIIYKVAYHNGEEVERKVDREEIVKEPVDEITVQGTKVKLGKKHKGACSWYSHTGTLSAANQWLPKGSYVKVTNKANGKSVIVQINDRGPFVAGRIIDLDREAFKKIAPLGAGVIDIKMEEIIP